MTPLDVPESERHGPRTVAFVYTNWKGETARRVVLPVLMTFGSTEWHPEPQWLLEAWDFDKAAVRTFAVRDIRDWRQNGATEVVREQP